MRLRLPSIKIRARLLPWLLLVGLSLTSLQLTHGQGADFRRYNEWASVFARSDIFALSGNVATPTGLPLTQWSFGPGLIIAFPDGLQLPSLLGTSRLRIVGVVSFFLTWLGVLLLLPPKFKRSPFAITASLLLIFYGSHAGFYSHHHSSESLSILLIVWLTVFLRDGDYGRHWKAAAFFTLGGLLCLCRLKLAPVAGLYFLVWAYRGRKVVDARHGWADAAIALTLLLLVGAMIGTANQWMTGSFFSSPYAVGDEGFRAAELLRPRFLSEVLFHPWHGLLVYHPLYAVGAGVLLLRLFQRRLRLEDGLGLIALVSLLYLHAGWFIWWLGTGSFGMRGLAPICLLLVLPVLDELAERRSHWLAWTLIPPVFWSFLLYEQGHTNFFTYAMLFQAQWQTWLNLTGELSYYSPIVIVPATLLLSRILVLSDTDPAGEDRLRSAMPYAAASFALLFLVSSLLFARTAASTRELMAQDAQWGRRNFRAVNNYNHEDFMRNLRGYQRVDGYEYEKESIRAFLERNPNIHYKAYLRDLHGARIYQARFGR